MREIKHNILCTENVKPETEALMSSFSAFLSFLISPVDIFVFTFASSPHQNSAMSGWDLRTMPLVTRISTKPTADWKKAPAPA